MVKPDRVRSIDSFHHSGANRACRFPVHTGVERYLNRNQNAGVVAYDEGDYGIVLQFVDGSTYLYTQASAGREHIDTMKQLARRGRGLTAYVNRHVSGDFAKRLA